MRTTTISPPAGGRFVDLAALVCLGSGPRRSGRGNRRWGYAANPAEDTAADGRRQPRRRRLVCSRRSRGMALNVVPPAATSPTPRSTEIRPSRAQ
jgi:hypothetical protein